MPSGMFSEISDPGERVRALCKYGCEVEVDINIPLKRYCRSGLEMIRMAHIYLDEGNMESAFVLYSKFITLFVEKLPSHPEFKTQKGSREREPIKKKIQLVFPLAEEIKKKLLTKYQIEAKKRKEEEELLQEELAKEQERLRLEEEKRKLEDSKFKEEESQRRKEEIERLRQEQAEQYRYLQEQERNKLHRHLSDEDSLRDSFLAAQGGPSIPQLPPGGKPDSLPSSYSNVAPGLTPSAPSMPSRDLKPASLVAPADNRPNIDRSSKPQGIDHFMSTGGQTGNKYGLRDVIVPAEVNLLFLNLALPNTKRNTETLGLLCGTLAQNAFRITHLVIPKQTGTSDSCNMEGEEEIFELQDKYDLITLGWIHTHPSQTAFLSSVDLHTHFPYQQMLPEAIAIVSAPKYDNVGYFYLTPDFGLQQIGSCKERGFHYHATEPPLFEAQAANVSPISTPSKRHPLIPATPIVIRLSPCETGSNHIHPSCRFEK